MTFINAVKGYKLEYKKSALKDLRKLEPLVAKEIENKLQDLIAGKPNLDVTKLQGEENPTYRLRYREYRVIFETYKNQILVLVVMVGHRREVYKRYRE